MIIAAKLPQRCKAGDTACLATAITAFMHDYPGGVPELGIEPNDPLYFGNLTVTQGGGGAVSVTLSLFECSIAGWTNMKVSKVM